MNLFHFLSKVGNFPAITIGNESRAETGNLMKNRNCGLWLNKK